MTLLFHASDLHFGREDGAALAWFVSEAERARPDAIVITGDLTMRARHSEFRAACRWLERLPAPVSVEVGNHDLPYFDLLARFFRPYKRYDQLERMIERPLALRHVSIVPLRTTARAQWRLNWSKGIVTADRLAETLDVLAGAQTPHRLIACHHPLIEAGTSGTAATRGGRRALRALATRGATAVLSGHVHDPFDHVEMIDGRAIRLIGAGTLSERLRDSRPGYNAIHIDPVTQAMTVDPVTLS
ncbi:metallophosphoesterase family protein [Sphingobium algorifonticola]|uniref:Metallophosphoesterase n=1 Tax=Sphingobium algorifonticola TaxID=2008318 RepID=A0A437JC11_9SPHN|nr:metallophosphoesterase [Sphingobium algorifonticola]RVT43172.1 metallophosphoesterase [Sphingobium algorifonticola]